MRSVEWHGEKVRMVDQRLLPGSFEIAEFTDHRGVARAIKEMSSMLKPKCEDRSALGCCTLWLDIN